jgi:hypothetical protein
LLIKNENMTVDEIKMRLESIAEWLDEDLPTEGDVRMAKAEIAELRQLLQAVVSGSLAYPIEIWDGIKVDVTFKGGRLVIQKANDH